MASRLPIRTITEIDSSFFLSSACNVIEAGDLVDSSGVLASAVLKFHVPEDIGELNDSQFAEIRKRYEELREAFPLYLRDLGELIQINEVRQVPELAARIESLVQTLGWDITRIKRSRVGQSIRKWLPVGIGSAVTYVTGGATVLVHILAQAIRNSPIPSRLQGAQSLLTRS